MDLKGLGYDEENIHFAQSVARHTRALQEFAYEPPGLIAEHTLGEFLFDGPSTMITFRDISCSSLCPHHIFPVLLKVDFAYIPKKKAKFNSVGLSKVPRFIKKLAKRMITQEELTHDIVTFFYEIVNTDGCIAVTTATHTCMSCRGVEANGTDVVVSAISGKAFENAATRQEFLSIIKL